uniref:Uncharacterized protein n=1 Tax=viral metagenome TaxID=1070528 RepID=A0A6C0KYG4_9ZZZZ|tara:strand:- start:14297 stop:14866 length:570 start_codon:yes stop_codon:yes gene_type:complete
MNIYYFFKTSIIFCLSVHHTNALKPTKLPSGKDRVYKFNHNNPELDVGKITASAASFVSRHWLNNIILPKRICQEDTLIIEKINKLEQFMQDQFTRHREMDIEYLAWMPQGISSEILFLIVVEAKEDKLVLRMLINSPFWESNQISTDCLLESLNSFSLIRGKTLDIDSFLSNNIRYKLIWQDFKLEQL